MHDIIQIVNAKDMQCKLDFCYLCNEGEAKYTDLLYHVKVWWFPSENVLNRVNFKISGWPKHWR